MLFCDSDKPVDARMSSRYPPDSSVDADAAAAGPPTVLKIGFLNYEDGASAEELREKRAEHEEAYDVLPKGDGVGVGFEHITMMVETLVPVREGVASAGSGELP